MRETDIFRLLRKRYPKDRYALLPQVGDATGGRARRYADAIAMSLWPSRGLGIEGVEIKSHRNDWKRELDDPAKAESIYRFCDRWWVAAPDGVVKIDELPPTWGLYEVTPERVRVVVKAPELNAAEPTRQFVASLLRGLQRHATSEAELEEAREAGYKDGIEAGATQSDRAVEALRRDHKRLLETVQVFEQASGVSLARYASDPVLREGRNRQIGEAVRAVLEKGDALKRARRTVFNAHSSATRMMESLAAVLGEIDAVLESDEEQLAEDAARRLDPAQLAAVAVRKERREP